MQRALLLESGIPLKLWPYAAKAAAYLRNRCFYSPTQMTPIEAATGARPNMSNLALFGSRCFAYLGNHKSKFDPRSTPAVFIGYDDYSPSYLVYLPDCDTVRKVRQVHFTNELY